MVTWNFFRTIAIVAKFWCNGHVDASGSRDGFFPVGQASTASKAHHPSTQVTNTVPTGLDFSWRAPRTAPQLLPTIWRLNWLNRTRAKTIQPGQSESGLENFVKWNELNKFTNSSGLLYILYYVFMYVLGSLFVFYAYFYGCKIPWKLKKTMAQLSFRIVW